MKDANRNFVSPSDFSDRVKKIMKQKDISISELHAILTEKIKYDIEKPNLSIYLQRVPNTNFLVALSKALEVSTDYLLGIDNNLVYTDGFKYNYTSKNYSKYHGEYYFYFYPTVSNSPKGIHTAKLSIPASSLNKVHLDITNGENKNKHYSGNLLLSDSYSIGYITLKGDGFGEIVNLSFCDPTLNMCTEVNLIIGAMLSVSSGDMKRLPVMSRFIFSRTEISEDKFNIIKANLMLNTKYINITAENIKDALEFSIDESLDKSLDKPIDKSLTKAKLVDTVFTRLTAAFIEKKYYRIEESFITNTLEKDYCINESTINKILTTMRLKSMSNANSKVNRTLDSRIIKALSLYKDTSQE